MKRVSSDIGQTIRGFYLSRIPCHPSSLLPIHKVQVLYWNLYFVSQGIFSSLMSIDKVGSKKVEEDEGSKETSL